MVLKSLILQGFKSFPDKTEIHFTDGVTAVVGPNGSGKSNIADAVRWALGEQSTRSLRGTKMEDVIFSGTAKRRAVGFAEVSLILDNSSGLFRSEFTEIMVTRRFYRSGESEYFLNRKRCRLRDVQELFMDTGLGRDGYSIIGQGRIDEILSLKSEDRREIFEEAAGISKFRWRKEEAERKLSATEDNLTRIQDLYNELERRIGPLEKQAEKAKQYLLLRDELRVLEVSLWLDSLSRLQKEAEELGNSSTIVAGQLADVKRAQKSLYEHSEKLGADIREADRESERLRMALRETERLAAEQAERAAVLRANAENAERNMERIRSEDARRGEQTERMDAQIAERRAHLVKLNARGETLLAEMEVQERQTAAQTQRREAEEKALNGAETAQAEHQQALHALALNRTAAESGLSSMDSRQATLLQERQAVQARLESERQTHTELETRMKACQETLASAKNKMQGVALKADNRRAKTEELRAAAEKAVSALTDAQNRARMLADMQRDYEGFSRAVKTIMAQAGRGALTGIHGPVSSLLSAEEMFVTAIDTALGMSASSIVVDTAVDGKRCIEYLKHSDSGRATFLPLDTIRPAALREEGLENRPGCYGTADRLVTFDGKYTSVIKNLLARTVVCENMDSALALARVYKYRFRIVTLDGQILQAGGAMTGGSVSRGTGALARAAALRAAQEQIQMLGAEREKTAQAYQAAKAALAALEYDVKAIDAERARAEQDDAALRAAVQQHQALLDSLQRQADGLTREQDSLDAVGERCRETIAACAEKQTAQQAAVDDAARKAEYSRAALSALADDAAKLAEQMAALQTSLAENRTEVASETRALRELERLKEEADAGRAGAAETLAGFAADIQRFQAELAQLEKEKESRSTDMADMQAQISAQVTKRESIEGERAKTDRAAQQRSEEILNLEKEAARLENRAAQMKNNESQILEKMWEEYELTPTPAAEIARPINVLSETQARARELRGKMKALGNVNLDAMDEYTKAKERYTFMREQKEDLEKARRELRQVMDQLTEKMKVIFADAFERLNVYFGETFQEIFEGGKAELLLADKNDILNCGIEIRVSPPGKALKTLSLLSGGERAFVAIALYFAILKLRPTPFCILDEIEAALDDVNVARYAAYLRRLTAHTQFIVITHRRGTMEASDMLYGVTMQEQGVSKLLMLNLAEAEEQLGKSIQ